LACQAIGDSATDIIINQDHLPNGQDHGRNADFGAVIAQE
jgi:hypothetical protein